VNVKRKLELDLEKEQSPTKNVDIRKKWGMVGGGAY
jgi:hypothetical protein